VNFDILPNVMKDYFCYHKFVYCLTILLVIMKTNLIKL